MGFTTTYDIIVPIYDLNRNIVDWKIIARVMASSSDEAIRFAKHNYGIAADVRKA